VNTIHFSNGQHSDNRVIHIYSSDNQEIIEIFKSRTSAICSKFQRYWNIFEDDFNFSVVKILRGYYKENKPTIYLFERQNIQHQYSGKSITHVIKQAAQNCRNKKEGISPYSQA